MMRKRKAATMRKVVMRMMNKSRRLMMDKGKLDSTLGQEITLINHISSSRNSMTPSNPIPHLYCKNSPFIIIY